VKYAAIADWAADKEYSVTFMCAQLGVVRQGYYRWLADGPCQRERTDAELTEQIREIHRDLHGHPGVRRVWAELVVRGVRVARKRVWRLMRAAGLRGRFPRAWKKTTTAGRRPIDAPDLIGQDFTAAAPNTRWVADFTEVGTWAGIVYAAFVIDCYSRFIVGWRLADHMRTDLPLDAMEMALHHKGQAVHHSDHGSQYLSIRYTATLAAAGVNCSAGSVGDSYDNALAETVIGLYKAELIRRHGPWRNLEHLELSTLEWVDWYDNRRLHSWCGNTPPAEYEAIYYTQHQSPVDEAGTQPS
jgi:transposase InsO family protein